MPPPPSLLWLPGPQLTDKPRNATPLPSASLPLSRSLPLLLSFWRHTNNDPATATCPRTWSPPSSSARSACVSLRPRPPARSPLRLRTTVSTDTVPARASSTGSTQVCAGSRCFPLVLLPLQSFVRCFPCCLLGAVMSLPTTLSRVRNKYRGFGGCCGSSPSVENHLGGGKALALDPFLSDEPNPSKCRALDSSLWELEVCSCGVSLPVFFYVLSRAYRSCFALFSGLKKAEEKT